ncbi:glycosyltransferase family 2 protein [Dactylosporangium sp. NPDC051541]|uniref:glycosyltransferase family 2 protein n=1 Tax=Dactylosporangium sp. NPDC051541 TaxID=3363977 RepID=UPI0037A047D3
MSDKGLSVVIPVKGRVAAMRRLLASLRESALACEEPVEILVVDDSGPDDTRAHTESCATYDARYLRGPKHVGAKRNAGVRAAAYDLVLFIDSDCLATPQLLQRHTKTLRDAGDEVGAVAGPTFVQGVDNAMFRIMARSKLLNSAFEWPAQASRVGWATTSNLAVRRAAFEAVGGFAPRPLTVVGGEDVDLGLRLTAAGHAIVCDAEAVVVHDKSSIESLGTVCRRLVTYGRSGQWLLDVHPDRGRPKLNRVSALSATAAAGAAAAPVTAGAGLLLLPAVAAVLLTVDTKERLGDDAPTVAALTESIACAGLDWCFDLGEFLAAWQLGRPDRLFTGFGWTDEGFVWDREPEKRYGS